MKTSSRQWIARYAGKRASIRSYSSRCLPRRPKPNVASACPSTGLARFWSLSPVSLRTLVATLDEQDENHHIDNALRLFGRLHLQELTGAPHLEYQDFNTGGWRSAIGINPAFVWALHGRPSFALQRGLGCTGPLRWSPPRIREGSRVDQYHYPTRGTSAAAMGNQRDAKTPAGRRQCSTVHRFQGYETDLIVLDLADAESLVPSHCSPILHWIPLLPICSMSASNGPGPN